MNALLRLLSVVFASCLTQIARGLAWRRAVLIDARDVARQLARRHAAGREFSDGDSCQLLPLALFGKYASGHHPQVTPVARTREETTTAVTKEIALQSVSVPEKKSRQLHLLESQH